MATTRPDSEGRLSTNPGNLHARRAGRCAFAAVQAQAGGEKHTTSKDCKARRRTASQHSVALTILSAPRGACRISMILTPLSRTHRAGARPRRFPYDRMGPSRVQPAVISWRGPCFNWPEAREEFVYNTVFILTTANRQRREHGTNQHDWIHRTGGAWDDATRALRPEKQPLLAESGRRSDAAHSVCLRPCDGHQEDILATSLARRPRRRARSRARPAALGRWRRKRSRASARAPARFV